ncbi:hypothetical protein D7X25_16555 [bacterium 1XD42-8]|jgi:multidrug efflux pump subunit AcrA (membrane-fusion protein)|nr:hypothetical protein [Lachnospiraceae bacterium]RKJ51484.1 hypothetical protein D7X25_16555 [bacterium 1XD42-8]
MREYLLTLSQLWKEKKVSVLFSKFLLFMLLCTILSRGIYAQGIAQVTTVSPRKMSISHKVQSDGFIEKKQEASVNIPPGIPIESVFVKPGQMVEKNTPLFQIDMDGLQEMIIEDSNEIEKLTLQINDIAANQQFEAKRDAQNAKRAAEDYALAQASGNRQIGEAAYDLQKSQEELGKWKDFASYLEDNLEHDLQRSALAREVERLKEELNMLNDSSRSISVNVIDKEEQIRQKKIEIENASKSFDDYVRSMTNQLEKKWKEIKENLEEDFHAKEKAYYDTGEAAANSLLEAGRTIEDASMQKPFDSTLKIYQLDREEKIRKLAKLQEIQAMGGTITSDILGFVTQVTITPGERSKDSGCILLALMEESLSFCAPITKEQKKYVDIGDTARIHFHNNRHTLENLTIERIEEDTANPENYFLYTNVPAKNLTIGQNGSLEVVKQSESYPYCVPLGTLHGDGINLYVLVLHEKETILGKELSVERRNVKVIDKNETYAALNEGSVTEQENIILTSTKPVTGGDIVRLFEE